MFKCLRRVCGKIMNVTCKTVEKLFGNKELRNDIFTFLLGGCGLSLMKEMENKKMITIGLGVGITIYGILGYLEKGDQNV